MKNSLGQTSNLPTSILSGLPTAYKSSWSNYSKRVGRTLLHPFEKKTPPLLKPPPAVGVKNLSRPAGALESFFKQLGDFGASANLEHAAVHVVLQIQLPSHVTEANEYIARAWEEVGRLYPGLNAKISSPYGANSYNQTIITQQSFTKYSSRDTFSVHPGCSNVDTLLATTCPKRDTTTCYWLPDPSQIVIRASHWCIDGFGVVMLSDVLLSTLANLVQNGFYSPVNGPIPELQISPIAPSLEHLVRMHAQDTSYRNEAEDIDDLMNTFVNGGRSIGIPTLPGSSTAIPTVSTRAAIRLNVASSAEIVRACRAQGVSVTSAVNAAIIRATAQFPQDPEADSYVIFAPVDLRKPLIAAGAKECLEPVGTYVSGLPLRIEGVIKHLENGDIIQGKSFECLAYELNSFYSQDVLSYKNLGAANGKTVNLLHLAEPYMERMTKFFSLFPSPGCPYPKTPVISSLGKMDTLIKSEYPNGGNDVPAASKLRVTDFWIFSESATPMITFNPWSWEDEITLSASWNESYYSRELARKVLEMTVQELGSGLKIGKPSYRTLNNCCDAQTQVQIITGEYPN